MRMRRAVVGLVLAGLAADGGLYVPETWPALPSGWRDPRPYVEVANHQSFVDTRHGSAVDVAVDSLGIALAALAISLKPQAAKTKQFKDAGRSSKRAY